MWRSLPLISSIRLRRSLKDKPIKSSLLDQSVKTESVNCFAGYFLQGRHTRRNFDQPAAPQRDHAALNGFLFELDRRSSNQTQLSNLIVNFHDFIKAATALVSRVLQTVHPLPF